MDPFSLAEAVHVTKLCMKSEKELPLDLPDNVWEDAVNLEPLLTFVAQPTFVPPSNFAEVMRACAKGFLLADEGQMEHAEDMVKMMEDPWTETVFKYLEWLEPAMQQVFEKGGNPQWGSTGRQGWVAADVQQAVNQWPGECARLRENAAQLWDCLHVNAQSSLVQVQDWQKWEHMRGVIQARQEDECARIADEIEATMNRAVSKIRDPKMKGDWHKMATTTKDALGAVKMMATKIADAQADKVAASLEEYQALDGKQDSCRTGLLDKRQQVRRSNQSLTHSEGSFTKMASQLVSWTVVVVPKVRALKQNSKALRRVMELNAVVPRLQREKVEAEDELDAASSDLRRLQRHSTAVDASRLNSPRSPRASTSPSPDRRNEARLAKQARESAAKERLREVTDELDKAMEEYNAAASELPVEVISEENSHDLEEFDNGAAAPITDDELANKFEALRELHASAKKTDNSMKTILDKVEHLRTRAAVKNCVEPAFLCPLTHKPLTDPVVAYDGFTYERSAIEKWHHDHDYSPMTGQPFTARDLIKNYALRELVETHSTVMTPRNDVKAMSKEHMQGRDLDSAAKNIHRKYRLSVGGPAPLPEDPTARKNAAAARIQAGFRRSLTGDESKKATASLVGGRKHEAKKAVPKTGLSDEELLSDEEWVWEDEESEEEKAEASEEEE